MAMATAVGHDDSQLLDAVYSLSPVIAWGHLETVIRCGTSWLTIANSDQTLLRIAGLRELARFYRLLCATIVPEGAEAAKAGVIRRGKAHFNTVSGQQPVIFKPFGDSRHQLRLVFGEFEPLLSVAALAELQQWLGRLLAKSPVDQNTTSFVVTRIGGGVQLTVQLEELSRTIHITTAQAIKLQAVLLAAAETPVYSGAEINIGHNRFLMVQSGNWRRPSMFELAVDNRHEFSAEIGKQTLVILAAQLALAGKMETV